jgi:hypothetical protein
MHGRRKKRKHFPSDEKPQPQERPHQLFGFPNRFARKRTAKTLTILPAPLYPADRSSRYTGEIMLRRNLLMIGAVAALPVLSGCFARPELTAQGAIPAGFDTKKIETAILKGCTSRGWQAKKQEAGLIVAVYTKGRHIAAVNIRYSDKEYSITKNDQTNLVHPDGQVDNKYNQWVKNLDLSIRTQLATSEI